jgi:hypothetical protein
VRLAYLDEAGISSRLHEPYLVVVGVIIHPDNQWKDIDQFFHELSVEYFPHRPPGRRVIFHAKDIWHGSGDFERGKWPLKKRMKLLSRLAEVPTKFSLPIVFGYIDRARHERMIHPSIKTQSTKFAHVFAFLNAVSRVERWMRDSAANEVIMLIVEDTDKVKAIIRALQSAYTDPGRNAALRKGEIEALFPFREPGRELMARPEPFSRSISWTRCTSRGNKIPRCCR